MWVDYEEDMDGSRRIDLKKCNLSDDLVQGRLKTEKHNSCS